MICTIKPGYKIFYEKALLNNFNFPNTKINLRYLLCGPPKSLGEGIFYRIIQKKEQKCIQCIIFYKIQRFPYHPHDYHPFYIYLDDDNRVEFIILDDGHHFSKLISKREIENKKSINITIFLLDHGLTDQINRFSKPFKPKFVPLLPEQIKKWWLINNMAQLKLRTKLIDPWAPGLIPKVPTQKKSLLYRLNYILPTKIFTFAEENQRFTFRDEVFCPYCKTMETLDFMPLHQDPATGKYFLQKQVTCKNSHRYLIQYNFESGQIEYRSSH